eukprot:6606244-Alexandrium_andersonii.AAC.1
MLLLQIRTRRTVRRARGRFHFRWLRRGPRRRREVHEREVNVQGRGSPRRGRAGLAGSEAAEPHYQVDARGPPV